MKVTFSPKIQTHTIKIGSTSSISSGGATSSSYTIRTNTDDLVDLDDLNDVVAVDLIDGATLVYNQSTDEFEIKKSNNSIISLDGGNF